MNAIKFNTSKPQTYESFAGGTRTVRYTGQCLNCRTRLYSHDDGNDDPRGILGDHADDTLQAVDFGLPASLPDAPACFACQNDTEARYYRLLIQAAKFWKKHASLLDLPAVENKLAEWKAEYSKAVNGNY